MVMAQNTLITLSQSVMFWCINREHTVVICKERFEPWKGKEKLGKEKDNTLLPDAILTLPHGEKYNLQSRCSTFRRAVSCWPWCRGVLGDSWPSPKQHLWGGMQRYCFLGPWVHQAGKQIQPLVAPHISEGLTSFPCTQTGSPRPLWEKQTLYL